VPELWLARVDEEAEKIAPGPIPLRAEIIPPDQLDLMRARSPSARQTHALNDVDAYGTEGNDLSRRIGCKASDRKLAESTLCTRRVRIQSHAISSSSSTG